MIKSNASAIRSLPLKWHGGKHYLASKILEVVPPHVHYVEPYFGSGAVLFSKPVELIENHSEVINDVHGDLINFWQVLKSPRLFDAFQRSVESTPLSKPVWNDAKHFRGEDPVERAVAFFIRFRQSRQGIGRDFATLSRNRTRRGMNEQASSWLSAIEGLRDAHERLKRVVIYNEDATEVIRREDDSSTFYYLDPPYLHETRTAAKCYDFEMDESQHRHLLEVVGNIKGRFILSGYPSKLYAEAARTYDWQCDELAIDNKASSQKKKPQKIECLWRNF